MLVFNWRISCCVNIYIFTHRTFICWLRNWTSMLRSYLVCRERGRERETSKRHVGEAHSVLITAILLPQRLSCYWGKIVSLRMLTNLKLADLRLTTAQQRSTGQNLPSDPYVLYKVCSIICSVKINCARRKFVLCRQHDDKLILIYS
jgi:hypothetical protein